MDALIEALRAHQPIDATEAGYLDRMLALANDGAGTFGRRHFTPGHFTVSLFIVHPRSEMVLLHHHRGYDRWLPMGGHIEAGEMPLEAALREGAEESGLVDLELLSPSILAVDIHDIPGRKNEPDHQHFDVRYAATTQDPLAIKMNANESKCIQWVDMRRAVALMNNDAAYIRALAHLRGILPARGRVRHTR